MEDISIDADRPEPIYRQIADWMVENIRTGKWKKGYQLVAEEELARVIKVSRGTLRKAISVLIDQGLLVRIQGKGTFVEKEKISYPFAQELISFAESMESKGYAFSTNVLIQRVELPNEDIQNKLAIGPYDSILYIKRVRHIKDEPAILLENWVALKRCPGIEHEDLATESLFTAMENKSKAKISFGIRHFGATVVNQNQAELLDVELHIPVLTIDQVTYSDDRKPLECSHVLLRTDKYEVTSVLTR